MTGMCHWGDHAGLSLPEAADRLAIRELVDAYAYYADRRDAAAQMALFTEDTELVVFADGKGAYSWKAIGVIHQGCVLALTGEAAEAVQMLTCGITARRSTGHTTWMPFYLSCLARAYVELGQFDDAWRSIGDAMTAVETTKERWYEAEVHRVAGEIALN